MIKKKGVWISWRDEMKKDPKRLKEFLRRVMPPSRELAGDERDKILLLLALTTPQSQSNNQRFITEVYVIGDREYRVTHGVDWTADPMVEEMLNETDC